MDLSKMSREQLIQELQSLRSGDMFHILAETLATPIFIFQGTKMKYVNPAALELTGYSEKELLAQDFWEIIHPDFREMVKNRGMARQQYEEVPPRYDLKIVTKSGEERWLQYSGSAFEYRGEPAVLGTVVDITEYRNVKLALERFHTVMDHSEDAIFISDLKTGLFIDVNDTACRLLGYSREELLKLSPKDVDENYTISNLKEREKYVSELIRSGKPYISEIGTIRRKDGSTFPMELSVSVKEFRGQTYVLGIVRDITERQKMKERILQAEQRYRILYENVPSMYFTLKPDGTVISVNKFGAGELGYTVEELVGQSVLKVFQEKNAPAVLSQLQICLREPHKVHEWQIQKIRKDGTLLWVEEFARMVDDPDDTPNILIVCQDITRRKLTEDALQEAKENLERRVEERTSELVNANIFLQREISERKRVEEALEENRERLQTLMEKIPNGVGVVSLDGKMIYCNPALANLLEYGGTEILQIKLSEIVHPDDRQRLMGKLQHLFEGGPEYFSEYRVITKSGKTISVEVSSRRIIYDRKPVILSVVKDISERKKAEDALRLSEARYRALIEQAGDGIFVADENGNHLDVNSSGCNMLGYTREEILRLNVRDLYPVEDLKVIPPSFEALKKGETITRERRLRRKDGTSILAEATAKMLPDGRMQAIVRDITERKMVEEELHLHRIHLEELVEERTARLKAANRKLRNEIQVRKQAEKKLKQSGEQLRKLSAHIESAREKERTRIAREIHDQLGQSLSTLQMDLAWLELNLANGKDAVLEKIRSMSTFSGNMIKEVQRISQELRSSVLEHLGFTPALSSLTQEFQKKTGIRCDFICRNKDITLTEDQSNVLYRVSQEALTNIYRHANATHASVKLEEKNREIRLTICDNGIGIPQERINDPDALGLIGIRERLYFLKGKLDIKGIPKKGTTLIVTIPLEKKGEKIDEGSNR